LEAKFLFVNKNLASKFTYLGLFNYTLCCRFEAKIRFLK
jgi:hypothetical protein